MKKTALILALGFATATAYATTPPAPLWQTGQTSTAPINAPEGSDGNVEAGVKWDINDRFEASTNNTGDKVVTDKLTGLMWQQNPSVNNSGNTLNWSNALTACNNYTVTIDGDEYNDWRLPNRTELYSLIDWSNTTNPATALNAHGFTSVQANWYWSSSTYAPVTDDAWVVSFVDGSVDGDVETVDFGRAWCVRSGL